MNNKDKKSVVSIHLMFDGSEYTKTKVQDLADLSYLVLVPI